MKKELEEEYGIHFIDMGKLITNIWQIMIKTKNHRILTVGIKLFIWLGDAKLPVNRLEGIEDPFIKDFLKNYNEESYAWYLIDVNVQYPEKSPKNETWKNRKSFN